MRDSSQSGLFVDASYNHIASATHGEILNYLARNHTKLGELVDVLRLPGAVAIGGHIAFVDLFAVLSLRPVHCINVTSSASKCLNPIGFLPTYSGSCLRC